MSYWLFSIVLIAHSLNWIQIGSNSRLTFAMLARMAAGLVTNEPRSLLTRCATTLKVLLIQGKELFSITKARSFCV